jgi:hypothetical protein
VPDTPVETPKTPEKPAPKPVPEVSKVHVAIRDFSARFAHQILHFKQDQEIEEFIAKELRAKGAPIKLVEKLAEETKGRL